MKNWRSIAAKLATAVVAVGIATSTLTACSGAKINTLTVWADEAEVNALKNVAQEFQKQTGVKVDLVVKNNSRSELVANSTKLAGPDVVIGGHEWLSELVPAKLLAPVDLGLTGGNFQSVSLKAFNYAGRQYGVPYTFDNSALICNAAAVPAQPTDWSQVQQAGVTALIVDGSSAAELYPLQSSFGAKLFKTDGSGNYTDELAMSGGEGAKFADWLSTVGAKTFNTKATFDQVINSVKNGAKACMLAGTWVRNSLDLTTSEYNIYSVPTLGGQPATELLNARGYMITAASKDPETAQKFINDFANTKDVATALYQTTGRIPALNSALESLGDDKLAKGFAAAAANAEPLPASAAMNVVWQYWGAAELAILRGEGDAQAIWNQMIDNVTAGIKALPSK